MTEKDTFKTVYEPVFISGKGVKYVPMLETSLPYVLWDEVKNEEELNLLTQIFLF